VFCILTALCADFRKEKVMPIQTDTMLVALAVRALMIPASGHAQQRSVASATASVSAFCTDGRGLT